jgi:cell division protein FtsI/penicillin-binding protein 2
VAIEPATGRILALAEHSAAEPARAAGLAGKPMSPAASIFKVVTAAALLEQGVQPDENVCFHGGKHRISSKLLDDSSRDRRCMTLAQAIGHSANVAVAKLADRRLTPEILRAEADKLLFNAPLAVDGSLLEASPAKIPDDEFAFATAAAGFSPEVRLTPLHGAVLAATVANDGVAMPLTLIDDVDGLPVERAPGRRLFSREVARKLGGMLELTVAEGTARRAFRDRRRPAIDGSAAGKTGSLYEQDPFRDHTWFVGYAPAGAPTVAVSTVIVNDRIWHLKAPYVARETLRLALDAREARERDAARAALPGAGHGVAAPE